MRYVFDDCILDTRRYELHRAGAPIPLRPKVFQLLTYLLAHRDRVVSKHEILEQLWPDQFVGDATLNSCLMAVRKAVGDSGQAQRFIQTLRGRGYRFIAAVQEDGRRALERTSPAASLLTRGVRADASRFARVLEPIPKSGSRIATFVIPANSRAGETASARVASQSIAVLPFLDLSPNRDLGYFCDGVAEEILGNLSRVDGLEVAARTSSFQFKGAALDVREIGRRLDVSTILEGSVRRAGDHLRVNVQLVDVLSGYLLWSECFNQRLRDIFSVQEVIAKGIAYALAIKFGAGGRLLEDMTRLPHVKAYDFYVQGRHFFYRGGKDYTRMAVELFRRAIEVDPGYALAHAGLADAHSFLYMYYEPIPEHLEEAHRCSQIAVGLDPTLSEARAASGMAFSAGEQFPAAAFEFERAICLSPRAFEAYYLYGRACLSAGEFQKAANVLEEAAAIRPGEFHVPTLLAKVYRVLGRPDDALEAHRRAYDIVDRYLKHNPDDPRALCAGACALVEFGQGEKGLEWMDRFHTIDDPLLYYVACCFSRAGATNQALKALEQVVEAGWAHKGWLENDPDLDALRQHRRFRALHDHLNRKRLQGAEKGMGELWDLGGVFGRARL